MTTTQVQAPQVTRETRKFTAEEYFRMVEAGIIQEDERVELVEGEILLMPPMGHPHASGIMRHTRIFASLIVANRVTLLVQAPLPLSEHSAPEPNLALLKFREDDYAGGYASPEDTLLVIEVAESSLNYDMAVKSQIYGRAGIAEMWVLNLQGDCLERFTEPGDAGYAQHTTLRRREKISPVSLPDVELAVEDLLPPLPPAD